MYKKANKYTLSTQEGDAKPLSEVTLTKTKYADCSSRFRRVQNNMTLCPVFVKFQGRQLPCVRLMDCTPRSEPFAQLYFG